MAIMTRICLLWTVDGDNDTYAEIEEWIVTTLPGNCSPNSVSRYR